MGVTALPAGPDPPFRHAIANPISRRFAPLVRVVSQDVV